MNKLIDDIDITNLNPNVLKTLNNFITSENVVVTKNMSAALTNMTSN